MREKRVNYGNITYVELLRLKGWQATDRYDDAEDEVHATMERHYQPSTTYCFFCKADYRNTPCVHHNHRNRELAWAELKLIPIRTVFA